MTTTARDPIYAGYRYPAEIISYAVWLYFRFPLSLRMVEEMLAARGISVTHETIRQWGLKFGREFANRIRQRAPCRGDKWHLDEVVISIAGKKHWLWRAVVQDGFVLVVLVQSPRDKKAAKRLFRKLLKKQGRAPRLLVTDKLKSYAAAKREIMPGGTVKLAESKLGRSRVGRVNGWDDDDGSRPDLRWLSLPRGDHQLRGVAVFSVPVEPAHGRGDAGRPRHLGDARDDPAVGP